MLNFFGLLLFIGLLFLLGVLLSFAHQKLSTQSDSLLDKVNNILPQTQCGQCNYPGCKPYAKAILAEEAPINHCVPGGQETVEKIAQLLNIEAPPIGEAAKPPVPVIAEIIESDCIGCTLCIKACPVDAIIGSAKKMHTVIIDDCTGCELCVAPCPVDCIILVKPKTKITEWVIPITEIKPILKRT